MLILCIIEVLRALSRDVGFMEDDPSPTGRWLTIAGLQLWDSRTVRLCLIGSGNMRVRARSIATMGRDRQNNVRVPV